MRVAVAMVAVLPWHAAGQETGQPETVFVRQAARPLIATKPESWRSVSTANAGLLQRGGRMNLYLRGTCPGDKGQLLDAIGLFTQPMDGFHPEGPWTEHPGNPVIPTGLDSGHDALAVLDTAPVVTPDGKVYVYYSAKSATWDYSVGGAVSTDGGYTFEKFAANPLKRHVGVGDAVYHDGRFHLFYIDAKWDEANRRNGDLLRIYAVSSTNPEQFDFSKATVAVSPGMDAWDMYAVGGTRVFRLDNRWWMVYQGSDTHWDYPYRFHAAYSGDLVHWTKVVNEKPLFQRGPAGTWDQGAIWHGEVLPWNGTLYLFYEGWGAEGHFHTRNLPYFEGGCSQLGLATCSVEAFLSWAKGK